MTANPFAERKKAVKTKARDTIATRLKNVEEGTSQGRFGVRKLYVSMPAKV